MGQYECLETRKERKYCDYIIISKVIINEDTLRLHNIHE